MTTNNINEMSEMNFAVVETESKVTVALFKEQSDAEDAVVNFNDSFATYENAYPAYEVVEIS